MAFYAKCYQASSTYKALHNPWSHFIFSLWWVSLAEYLLVLRVLFPLLQMAQFIMVIARVASIPSWMRSKPWVGFFTNSSICFCGLWSYVGTILNYVGKCYFQTQFASAIIYQTWFVITLFHTLMMKMYLWTLCNMWHVSWIMYDLGCLWIVYPDPSWYSTDYRVYMGSSTKLRPLRRLPLYLCSYKLDGSIIVTYFLSWAHSCLWE